MAVAEHPYSICRGTRVFSDPSEANLEWPGKPLTVADKLQQLIDDGQVGIEEVFARQRGEDSYLLDRDSVGRNLPESSEWWFMKIGNQEIGWIPKPPKNSPCQEKAPAKRARKEIEYGQGIFGKAFFPGVEEGTKIISLRPPEREKIRRRSGSRGRPEFGHRI